MPWRKRKRFSVDVIVLVLLLLNGSHWIGANRDDLIIHTNSGRVRGVRYYLKQSDKIVDAFLGIPFAKAPLGPLRFKHPESIDPWRDVYNATQLSNSCYQVSDMTFGTDFRGSNMWNPATKVSEDCLYLNIWVPRTQPRLRKSAVMVWIFGGGFYTGTTTLNLYDGKILAAENNIIVASINYRVGAFGFFFLNSVAAPANAGMFDQLMGLEWIQKNINLFGGDPHSITLFGESAGAASISLHLLSPLSHAKFHRAILQSGSANMPWVALTMAEAKRRSLELAVEYLDCPSSDNMEVIADCMRKVRPQTLADTQYITSHTLHFPFLPVIDGTFLVDSPQELIRMKNFKKCPILIGSNLNEGSYFMIYELDKLLTLDSIKMDRNDFVKSMHKIFYYYPKYRQEINERALHAIIHEYTNWLDPDDEFENVLAIDRALGDSQFVCPLNNFAHAYAEASVDVYMYYLTQRYESNPWPTWTGVLHGDDIVYVFGEVFKPDHNYSQADKQLARTMMTYWTNFAKTGNPNQLHGDQNLRHWPLHRPTTREYLELNTRSLNDTDASKAIGRGPRIRECAFWDKYIPQLLTSDTVEGPDTGQSKHCNGSAVGSGSFTFILLLILLLISFLVHPST